MTLVEWLLVAGVVTQCVLIFYAWLIVDRLSRMHTDLRRKKSAG